MPEQQFFRVLDDHTVEPTYHATGPWDPRATHGGPPSALAVHELRRVVAEPTWRLSSLDVNLLGPVPLVALHLERDLARDGRRVKLARVRASAGGRVVLEACGWFMRTDPARVEEHPLAPPLPPPSSGTTDPIMDAFPYGAAIEWRFVDGSFQRPGPATVWATPRIGLVDEGPMTPLEAAALVADVANGISTVLPIEDWLFIPPNIHVNFVREPCSTTVAVSARSIIDGDGVGLCRATLLDEQGVFGAVLQTLFVAPRS